MSSQTGKTKCLLKCMTLEHNLATWTIKNLLIQLMAHSVDL